MSLAGKRVLIVEDENILAIDLACEVAAAGGEVVGPVSSVEKALHVIATSEVDGAILDVNLRGRSGFLVADALAASDVPFVIETGYSNANDLPPCYAGVPCLRKPFSVQELFRALEGAMNSARLRE